MHESKRSDVYLTEFAEMCENFAEVSVSWDDFIEVKGNYDFVHLHWPEYYFAGVKPSLNDLTKMNKLLGDWSRRTIIVVTRHNYLPHLAADETYESLYKIFYSNANIVHHLGGFSKTEFYKRYKGEPFLQSLKHFIIPHHFFYSYPSDVTKEQARNFLNISMDKAVMLVFGSIRKVKEKRLIATAFQNWNAKKRLLLVPRWDSHTLPKMDCIKKNIRIFGISYLKELWLKRLRLNSAIVNNNHIQMYFKAADFVFISRTDSLNSGLPYMYALFPMPMVGPGIGNITESMASIKGLTYDPENFASVDKVVNEVLNTDKKSSSHVDNDGVIESLKQMYLNQRIR